MDRISLKLEQGIAQFACSACSSCSSVTGMSLCSIKDRGCCWYFPKFTLHDIHRMTKTSEGLEILGKICALAEVRIYNYYIHAKGYFDEEGYKGYMESIEVHEYDIDDKTIFFRGCPFIIPGSGCTLPVQYRTCVCNFYICDEILAEASKYDEFQAYIRERDHYVKWVERENRSLEYLLAGMRINLADDFDEVIGVLKDIPLEQYEFPQLAPVSIIDGYDIGA